MHRQSQPKRHSGDGQRYVPDGVLRGIHKFVHPFPPLSLSSFFYNAAVQEVKNIHGLATADIIREIHEVILFTQLPTQTKIFLMDKLSELEYSTPSPPKHYVFLTYLFILPPNPLSLLPHLQRYRLSQGATEKVQLGALVGIFALAREQTAGNS